MAKQLTIKEIAQRSGVSAGTVDRILHGRGKVSPDKREKVEAVLREVGYKYNLHTSAVSLKREYRIVFCTPSSAPGDYWSGIETGFRKALSEYSDIGTVCRHISYNQFDGASCREAYGATLELEPDAVIIGPTIGSETVVLCRELDRRSIPYVFVDTFVKGTNPVAAFSSDQAAGGYLMARLLKSFIPAEGKLALLRSESLSGDEPINLSSRMEGFRTFLRETSEELICAAFSMSDSRSNAKTLRAFLEKNPDVKGIAVLNSRGYLVSEALEESARSDIHLASFDLTADNIRCLNSGKMDFILCQRPEAQGFLAVKSILEHLLYRRVSNGEIITLPIDVVFKENLPFYRETL